MAGGSQQGGFDNRENFGRLTTLCAGRRDTQVYMQSGVYWTTIRSERYGFRIPSNTIFHSLATIKEIANDFKTGKLISIYKAENVVIDGGSYMGDLDKHTGKEGEWSHGIECRASSNVMIKNVICREFWGDGINIIEGYDKKNKPTVICQNITIDNVICYYNCRQGLSIEAVNNCSVRNSEFSYTGKIKHTDPAVGLDIEAWSTVADKITNVLIENCIMMENHGFSLQCYANAILEINLIIITIT